MNNNVQMKVSLAAIEELGTQNQKTEFNNIFGICCINLEMTKGRKAKGQTVKIVKSSETHGIGKKRVLSQQRML
jgi:hypothetical protein